MFGEMSSRRTELWQRIRKLAVKELAAEITERKVRGAVDGRLPGDGGAKIANDGVTRQTDCAFCVSNNFKTPGPCLPFLGNNYSRLLLEHLDLSA